MKINDDVLIELIRSRNHMAYTFLFEKYYKPLIKQAAYILKDTMEAEDQVQNLFIEIIDGKLGVNVNSSLNSYLKTCMYHKCLVVLNKHKRTQQHLDSYAITHTPFITYDYFQKRESQDCVDQLLKGLSMQRLKVCKLVYLDRKKYKEAAVEMGITISSVKTHLRLATKTLRAQFADSRTQVLNVLYA